MAPTASSDRLVEPVLGRATSRNSPQVEIRHEVHFGGIFVAIDVDEQ